GKPTVWLALVMRDRERRRLRLRRSLYVTAALAASVLVMLAIAYINRPLSGDGKAEPTPFVDHKKDVPPPKADKKPEPEKEPEPQRHEPPPTLVALTGKLADKTLDKAKVLLAAANPVEGIPMGDLANAPALEPLDPAAQPIRQ